MQNQCYPTALLPNKIVQDARGPATPSDKTVWEEKALEIRKLYHY